ncbi:MAG: tripartite tricarboxylate transporter substrate binding protein [Burkholderiales bacterium]|nr:tripartite tricarboxylate transporter substrate binding protein [Burkholderiales bacterium]
MKTCKRALPGLGLALLACGALESYAQSYPNRPVRVIVPLAPGGSMDMIARALSQKLGESLRQNFVVDNRPGAGSSIGLETAAVAPADGHTIVIVSATVVTYPILYQARFDVLRDFTPVSQITAQGYLLALTPSVPARTVPELIAHLRANPGKLNFASSGIGSLIHLSGELFMVSTGTRMTHVPYKGMGAAYGDLVSGNIELAFPTIVSSQPHIRAGRLRGLAVTLPERAAAVPDLPTMAEAGVSNVIVTNWYGVLAPARTPGSVIEQLNREIAVVMRQPDMMKRLLADGSEAVAKGPGEFRAHVAAERSKWARLIKQAGIKGG